MAACFRPYDEGLLRACIWESSPVQLDTIMMLVSSAHVLVSRPKIGALLLSSPSSMQATNTHLAEAKTRYPDDIEVKGYAVWHCVSRPRNGRLPGRRMGSRYTCKSPKNLRIHISTPLHVPSPSGHHVSAHELHSRLRDPSVAVYCNNHFIKIQLRTAPRKRPTN